MQCVKSVRIRTYSGPHIPTFGLNTERLVQFFINGTLRNFPFFFQLDFRKDLCFTSCFPRLLNKWYKVFKAGPSKICRRQPYKFHLVHSWILCPKCIYWWYLYLLRSTQTLSKLFLSNTNQSIDLLCQPVEWFSYDRNMVNGLVFPRKFQFHSLGQHSLLYTHLGTFYQRQSETIALWMNMNTNLKNYS